MGPSPLTWAHPSSLPLAAWGPIRHSDTSSKKQGCSQTLSSPGLQALPISPVLSLALSWVHTEQPGHRGELRVLRRTSRMTQRKRGEVFFLGRCHRKLQRASASQPGGTGAGRPPPPLLGSDPAFRGGGCFVPRLGVSPPRGGTGRFLCMGTTCHCTPPGLTCPSAGLSAG